MAMGKRKERQEVLFVTYEDLPRSTGHPFYVKLNQLLAEAGFDRWIEQRCQPYYAQQEKRGQPSIPPGVYFRMLLGGRTVGVDSTTLEANAAMNSIVRRDAGEDYQAYLTQLMWEEGLDDCAMLGSLA